MVVIRPAVPGDMDAVKDLCALVLPKLVKTNSTPWDSRVGAGATWGEPLLLVAVDPGGNVQGFAAASPAFLQDHGLAVRWWCLDLVGVKPRLQGQGIGEALLREVFRTGVQAGVSCMYGLCDQAVVGWYAKLGFATTPAGGFLDSNVRLDGAAEDLTVEAPQDQCFVLTDICQGQGPRLFIP